jgi:RHS repeat-associated protein
MRIGEQSDLTDFGYTGQRLDESTGGLMVYGARYYLPELRRFISADTIVPGAGNPQNLNRYAYVRNNPVNLIDPTGHRVPTDEEDQWWGMDPPPPDPDDGGGGDSSSGSGGDDAGETIGNATEESNNRTGRRRDWRDHGYRGFDPLGDLIFSTTNWIYAPELGDELNDWSSALDWVALGISGTGTAITTALTVVGCMDGPEGCVIGFWAGEGIYSFAQLNSGADAVSGLGSAFQVGADMANGETRIDVYRNRQNSIPTVVIVVGEGTLAEGILAGTGAAVNISLVDAALDYLAVRANQSGVYERLEAIEGLGFERGLRIPTRNPAVWIQFGD